MLEIEMKFPVPHFQDIEVQLERWQARPGDPVVEEDLYYRPPDRDFAKTDEAVRLRRTGAKNVATYKGPKEPGPTKTRTEIEVPLRDGPDAVLAFKNFMLGLRYQPVAVVRKNRVSYSFERDGFALTACLDQVDRIGWFVELEIVTDPSRKAEAQQLLLSCAAELNLGPAERRSYLELVLEELADRQP